MRFVQLSGLTLLAVGVFSFVNYWSFGGVTVTCSKVEVGSISEYVDVQAKTRLPQTHRITMPFAGRIEPIDLEEGRPVTKGQLLARTARVDVENLVTEARAAVERLEAQLRHNANTSVEQTQHDQAVKMVEMMDQVVAAREAQTALRSAELEYAELRLSRVRATSTAGASTASALDLAIADQATAAAALTRDEYDYRASQFGREAAAYRPIRFRNEIAVKELYGDVLEQSKAEAEARLQQALRRNELSEMFSPIDGVVLKRLVTDERFLPAGTELLEVGRLEEIEIEADVLSQDVAEIRTGAPVDIYGAAVGAEPVQGTVRRIDPAAFTKVSSLGVEEQRVTVVIDFPAEQLPELLEERNLGVGFQLRVRIYTQQKSQAPIVPRSAVFRGSDGQWQAFVVRDGRARLQPLQIGLANDDFAEVTDGLPESAVVVLAPDVNIADGVRVRPVIRKSARERSLLEDSR